MLKKKSLLVLLALFFVLVLPFYVSAQTTLIEQAVSATNQHPYFSNMFVPSNTSDTFLADDFVNDKIWDISTIFIPGDFWAREGAASTLANAAGLHWKIYEDASGKPDGYPGDAVTTPFWELDILPTDPRISLANGTDGFASNITLDLSATPIRVPPGTYWLIFYPELDFDLYGAYGRQPSDTENNAVAQFIEPGGGDSPPLPTVWTSVLDIVWTDISAPALTQQDFAFTLQGNIIDQDIAVTPTTIAFGNNLVNVASDPPEIVTITNNGTTDLTISSVTKTGTSANMFTVATGDTDGCALTDQVLIPTASCTLSVTFTPTAAGAQSAAIVIASDDPESPTLQVALSGTGVEALLSPAEGTVGTEITIEAAPGGTSFGDKKGKVVIQNATNKFNAKIAKDGWSSTSITCTINKALPAGVYDVKIMLQPYKDDVSIDLPGAFTFKKPEVDLLAVSDGAKGDRRVITGHFFGNKKPKVYLVYQDSRGSDKKKNCPVTSMINWVAVTGVSSIEFKVPGGLAAGTYPLYVERKGVGISEEEVDFTITE